MLFKDKRAQASIENLLLIISALFAVAVLILIVKTIMNEGIKWLNDVLGLF
ncbi:MAG: hypothetical protein N3D73_01425 [Candidatus Diapherotrites archaeon]|nr:hypothetical protein [Candidatus Diapherotrites archaeon]